MEKKTCFKCGAEKPLTDFYKHPKMSGGRVNKCKECNKRDVRENRADKIEYYREYDAHRFQNDPRVKERHKRYAQTDAGKAAFSRSSAKYRSENPEKRAAHVILGSRVKDGTITKPDHCSKCGAGGMIHGHHHDYALPLDVEWLCPQCHVDAHKDLQAGAVVPVELREP